VFTTADSPLEVTEAGEYESAPAAFAQYGDYFWVETLRASTGEVIARGECGALGETTTVSPFAVTTTATQAIDAGDTAHDTLHLTGPIPDGVTATFTAYQQDGSGRDVCTANNQIGTSTPIAVPATDTDVVRSRSAAAFTATIPRPALTLPDGGRVHWVETLRLADGTIHHVGECGAKGETTHVTTRTAGPTRESSTAGTT